MWGMSADDTCPAAWPDWLSAELSELASAQLTIVGCTARIMRAISAADPTLAGIESLRLQNAVDQYRIWAAEVRLALEEAGESGSDIQFRLTRIQAEFRAILQCIATAMIYLGWIGTIRRFPLGTAA